MNASSTGLSTIIPIYVLALGGSVREVAIAFLGASFALVSKYFRKVIVLKAAA